jgi:MFS family permease
MKFKSITLLLIAEVSALSLWFLSAAILPEMLREVEISSFRQAALSSGVQVGFVVGALASAFLGLADRVDPRKVFAISAISAGLLNFILVAVEPGNDIAILVRVITGALLAGVYPVGMKIAVGWGKKDRGFLVGALVGALTLGSAFPHFIALVGGADWRTTVVIASFAAIVAGLVCLLVSLGPHHVTASKFNPGVITAAWTNKRVRLAYAGYFGHMWELYAMWAWIAAATAVSYSAELSAPDAQWLSRITAFVAIGAGAFACAFAGKLADKIGKAEVTIIAMALSGASALATAATFGGAPWITFIVVVVWGITIIPDSAQFSAIVADASPPEQAGSLMTFQIALGFTLTFFTVQATPVLASMFGWPAVLAGLALGPAFGIAAMVKLRQLG